MLKVEKELLQAESIQEISKLRAMELKYYVEHIGNIQTMATLLAGFSFTAFVTLQGGAVTLDTKSFFFRQSVEGTYEGQLDSNGSLVLEQAETGYDAMTMFTFLMQCFEVIAVTFTLGENLYVMVETLIARLLGERLALRGPDGSIDIATRHLANALKNSTRRFINGLQWFMLSVLMHALRTMHFVLSFAVLLVVISYWKTQFKTVGRLAKQFELNEATTTDFDYQDDEPGAPSDLARATSFNVPIWRRRRQGSDNNRPGGGRRRSLMEDAAEEVGKKARRGARMFKNLFNPLRELQSLFMQVDDESHHTNIFSTVAHDMTNELYSAEANASSPKARPTIAVQKLIMREMRREERGAQVLNQAGRRAGAGGSFSLSPSSFAGTSRTGGSSREGSASAGDAAFRLWPFRLPWQQSSGDLLNGGRPARAAARASLQRDNGGSGGDLLARLANFFLPQDAPSGEQPRPRRFSRRSFRRQRSTQPPSDGRPDPAARNADGVLKWIEHNRRARGQPTSPGKSPGKRPMAADPAPPMAGSTSTIASTRDEPDSMRTPTVDDSMRTPTKHVQFALPAGRYDPLAPAPAPTVLQVEPAPALPSNTSSDDAVRVFDVV